MKNLEKIFQISSFQTLFIVFYLIASIIIITIFFVKKVKWNIILFTSLIIGILGSIGINLLNINNSLEITEANVWLNMIPSIFLFFSLFFSPFLLGVKIIHLFLNDEKNKKMNYNFLLNIIIIFLILIISIPLLNFIVFDSFGKKGLIDPKNNIGLISWIFMGNVNQWYLSFSVFLFIIISSSIVGLTLFFIQKKKDKEFSQTRDVFSGLKMLLESSISYISKLLPLVIISIIPLMFISHSVSLKNLESLLIFIGVIIILLTVSISVLWLINKKDKYASQNISLLLNTLLFPMVISIITYLNYQPININIILFLSLLFFVGGINYFTYYKEIEHEDNFIETSLERSSIIILGSFTLITSIYLYLLIAKPIYEIFKSIYLFLNEKWNKRVEVKNE